MDTERLAEFVSTLVIVAGIAFFALPSFGVTGLEDRLLYAATIAVVPFAPIVYLLVYHVDLDTYLIGPWDPADVVFLAVAAPGIVATVWVADEYLGGGALYWIVVVVGVLASIALGVVVRSLTVGEWPPGAATRREREGGPPGLN